MTSTAPTMLFVIVGKNEPLYEAEFNKAVGSAAADSVSRQNYFVLHSALDLVEKAAWTTSNMYLKVVDKVRTNNFETHIIYISSTKSAPTMTRRQDLTAQLGSSTFPLFFVSNDMQEEVKMPFETFSSKYMNYMSRQLSMNPFYKFDSPITSESFDTRVRALARRYVS
eukprot:scaffold4852_cov50-Attheya_sp.AAC.3